VFDPRDWDSVILKYVVPKLGATLRNDFQVNPRSQEMEPLERVFEWVDLINPTVFSQILETEFFPKWLDTVHLWLTHSAVNTSEVAEWFEFWKEKTVFVKVAHMPGVQAGFRRGVQLMAEAMDLGPEAPTKLVRPDFRAERNAAAALARQAGTTTQKPVRSSARTQEITFRSIVEEFAANHNLMFVPAGRAHEKSRMPMFRVSPSADGKGGILVYILDDAVWAAPQGVGSPDEDFRAISLDDMVLRAAS
jgi:tuftelin-interacting protein 11